MADGKDPVDFETAISRIIRASNLLAALSTQGTDALKQTHICPVCGSALAYSLYGFTNCADCEETYDWESGECVPAVLPGGA